MADGPFDTLRFDHIGGLRRPDWLRELYRRFDTGAATAAELRAGQDRAVAAVLRSQGEVGATIVTDGEFRRHGFQDSFGQAVSGFAATPYGARTPQPAFVEGRRNETGPSGPGPAVVHRLPVTERLKLVRNVILEEYQLGSPLAPAPMKVTLIGPDRISQRFEWEHSQQVYPDMDEFLGDVVAIERAMIAAAVAAGCRYVQIDAPGFTAYVDKPLLQQMRERGEDPAHNLARSIAAENAIIDGFPGVTFGIHVCRGNGPGWHREGYYDDIAEQLFTGLRHQRLLLEYDTERPVPSTHCASCPRGRPRCWGW